MSWNGRTGAAHFSLNQEVSRCVVLCFVVSLFVVSYVVHIYMYIHVRVEDIVLLGILKTYLMYLAKWCS